MTRPDKLQDEAEWLEHMARCARTLDPMLPPDDLAPARGMVWLVFAWACVIVAMVLLLGGCGGGIDTPDELMGPTLDDRVKPPRPCPVSVPECRSQPTPG
jgi:hypothetical protein